MALCKTLIFSLFDHSNEVIVNEKIKFRKRFHFHKKPKNAASSISGSPACPTRTLTSNGIAQLRQLKEFLMQDQSLLIMAP